MDRFSINLSSEKGIKSVLPLLTAVVLGVFALLMTVNTFYSYDAVKSAVASYEGMAKVYREKAEKLGSVDRGEAAKLSVDDIKSIIREAAIVNGFIAAEVYQWTELLSGIERAVPKGVSIAQVKPSFKDKSTSVMGMAKTKALVLMFVEKLSADDSFEDVLLVSHSEGKKGSAYERIMFSVRCRYVGGAL